MTVVSGLAYGVRVPRQDRQAIETLAAHFGTPGVEFTADVFMTSGDSDFFVNFPSLGAEDFGDYDKIIAKQSDIIIYVRSTFKDLTSEVPDNLGVWALSDLEISEEERARISDFCRIYDIIDIPDWIVWSTES